MGCSRKRINTQFPRFYTWFVKYQADQMKTKMLLPLRQLLGLGRNHYTTNDNENVNSIIKKKLDYKANELSVFCDQMKQLITRQKESIEQAFVMDTSPYRVHPKFKCLCETPPAWMKFGKIARDKKLRRIHSSPFKPYIHIADHEEVAADEMDTQIMECNKENMKQLSLSLADSGLPSQVFRGIWSKASEIINKVLLLIHQARIILKCACHILLHVPTY